MPKRFRAGSRRHQADFEQHDGTIGTHGNPTYKTSGDWDTIVSAWPCELLTTKGGESLRGRQVTADTTHVLFGEYQGATSVTTDMRAVIDGTTYDVVSVYDPDGDGREMRVELRIET